MKRLFIGLLLLVPPVCPAATNEWAERGQAACAQGNLAFAVRWDPSAGLRLHVAPTNAAAAVLLDLNRPAPRVRFVPANAYPAEWLDAVQFNADAMPTGRVDALDVVVKFRPDAWSVYLGDRPALVLPAPFAPPATVAHPTNALPPAARRAVRFQKTDAFVFHDDFLVPEGEENELAAWDVVSGNWDLHAVTDDYKAPPARRAKVKGKARAVRMPNPAMSPNFYSLRGSGTNGLLLAGYDFYDAYTVEAAVQTGPGEGGVVFDCTAAGRFHAFTMQPGEREDTVRFSLWRGDASNAAARVELAAVQSDIVGGQWVMLKARTFQNRIQCLVDRTVVIDRPAELPVGGPFGLFVDSDTPLRFDDVTARSTREVDLSAMSDLRRHVLAKNGRLLPRRRFADLFPPPEQAVLTPAPAIRPQWLILGQPSDAAHAFAADFELPRPEAEVGLIAGYVGAQAPYLRFVCQRDAATETFRLERVETNAAATVLRELTLPRAGPAAAAAARPLRLMCDATADRALRCYRDGELVLLQHAPTVPGGASGVYVGPAARVRIANLDYRFEREDLYTDQFEKNAMFVKDPFMRHWASPEGQWDDVTAPSAWYKGDVFGRVAVHLPLADGTAVHLGVPEGGSNGAWVVSVTNGQLALAPGGAAAGAPPALRVPTGRVTGAVDAAAATNLGYTVHAEGHWLWVTSGDALLLQQPLAAPLTGRRLRVTGFTPEQLAGSRVERYNVKDFLFKESLHEWTINGGTWEVINRFQCDPRWSHMDAESSNGLAAIWSKYRFGGDFCVEMYAGTRMGWYQRCGDYNLTVLNGSTTPSAGYTVTCSGWDEDLSQLYTRLYRDGARIAQSDVYCAPRIREGNVRQARLPHIPGGRDVHGAWYYIKLRRVGHRLEYYFDNELVLTGDDPDPLAGGSLGVWTYINSMVLARVKIAAASVAPKPLAFVAAPPAAPAAERPAAAPAPALAADGRPADAMRPEYWEALDPVSHARLDWSAPAGAAPWFAVTSVLGSGSLLARCEWPPVPYAQVAGWRFDARRTARCAFDFYYSVGRRGADGVYAPSRFYVHGLSGDADVKGTYRLAGRTDVPGSAGQRDDGAAAGAWTSVTAWLPVEGMNPGDTGLLVKVEGFGVLQPGYAAQGLTGNGPGEGYAIRGFSAIRYGGAPALALTSNAPPPLTAALWGSDGRQLLLGPTNWAAVAGGLDAAGGIGLTRVWLECRWSNAAARVPLAWVKPPTAPSLACAWSRKRPDTVEVYADPSYLNRAFAGARIAIGGVAVEPRPTAVGVLEATVPRSDACLAAPPTGLSVRVACGEAATDFALAWSNAPLRAPPVLLRLEGPTPLFENFEAGDTAGRAGTHRMRIDAFDPVQGHGLAVFNTGPYQRLASEFGPAYSLARYPVAAFRYRAGPMAKISLSLQGPGVVRLSESYSAARPARGGTTLTPDGQWHAWLGLASDAVGERGYDAGAMRAGGLRFASCADPDQTGARTELTLDDVTVGPAVASGAQLAFTPHYFDFEGVARVQMAVRGGEADYASLDATQRAAVAWADIANRQRATPDLKGLAAGVAHLLLRAHGAGGRTSQVTDIPFLLDTTAPTASAAVEPTKNPMGNGSTLKVGVQTDGGAPLDIEAVQLRWNDTVVPVTNALCSTFAHAADRDALDLNWPLIFRNQLDRSGNGQSFNLVVAGIRDGAGNAAPDVVLPRRIDYASDRTPPTLLPTAYPTNILWTTAWEVNAETRLFFTPREGAKAELARPADAAPCLSVTAPTGTGGVTYAFAPKWDVRSHPFLAFRLRRPARADLVLELDATNAVTWSLDAAGAPAGASVADGWKAYVLDVPALLKERLGDKGPRRPRIKGLGFALEQAATNATLQLQSVFVFAPWGAADRVVMDAYDESGMGGIVWESAQQAGGMGLAPGGMPGSGEGEGWITMRARDKAGNLSTPLYLPVRDPRGGAAAAALED